MTKSERKRIWWIASYPKSGNTWLRALISAYFDGELDINSMKYVTGDASPYTYHCVTPQPLETLNLYEEACLRGAALMHSICACPWQNVILKTHHANVLVEDMPLIPQNLTAGAVCIVRDPRDVAISVADHFGMTIDEAIASMEDEMRAIHDKNTPMHLLTSWNTHTLSWMRETGFRRAIVKYEDILKDPVERFARILSYMDVDVDKDKVAKAVDMCSFDNMREQEQEHGFGEKKQGDAFFARGRSTWRDVLERDQVLRIESYHEEAMGRLGYGTSDDSARRRRDDSRGKQGVEAHCAA